MPSSQPRGHSAIPDEAADTALSIVTIAAALVGALWTYNTFTKDRRGPTEQTRRSAVFKQRLDIAQSIVTIAAVFVGGLWTYNIFVKERHEYPHANIEQKLSHVALSKDINLLRVETNLTNTGHFLMTIGQSVIRVQQISPMPPCATDATLCAANEVNEAINKIERQTDHFSWPLIAERTVDVMPHFDVEPGEKQTLDFEFAIPSEVGVIRIYSYFRNEQKFKEGSEIGWATSSYYDFHAPNGGGKK